MTVQKLLSVAIATLVSLGTLLLFMDQSNPWPLLGMLLAATIALVVNDFKGWFRLHRNFVGLLVVAVVLIYMPSCLRAEGQAKILAVADMLFWLQIVLLFQKREQRVYWWLAVMSLLDVVVAAGFNRGVGFGALLFAYLLLGLFTLSLLVLYSDEERFADHAAEEIKRLKKNRPKAAPQFVSFPTGAKRTGLVFELYARLALLAAGTIVLSLVTFISVPRIGLGRLPWQNPNRGAMQVVGFNKQITLGELGPALISRQEVMQVRLQKKGSDRPLPPLASIYLRGAVVWQYADNQWKRGEVIYERVDTQSIFNKRVLQGGAEVLSEVNQVTTMEPNLDRDDLFYIPPLLPLKNDLILNYEPQSETLRRHSEFDTNQRSKPFEYTICSGGIVQGQQLELVPAEREVNLEPLLQMPGAKPALPNLTAQANACIASGNLPADDHVQIARRLETYLRDSGKFRYSLKGEPRDPDIDAIEDFIAKHPSGHCEYFATALALMLRTQNIPSRVALGYRCDEWDTSESCYRVRQLHAHAWVEAFIDGSQIPATTYDKNPALWRNGGWLRLDATPEGDLGSEAADRTTTGQWQRWFSNIQRRWDKYVVEMNRQKQQEAVFQPLRQTLIAWFTALRDPSWWGERFRWLVDGIYRLFGLGLLGILLGLTTVAALAALIYLAIRYLLYPRVARLARWRGSKLSQQRLAEGSLIEFYRRFEQIAARQGCLRTIGQTPREFGRLAGATLAQRNGQSATPALCRQLVEQYYRVRFGREPLDKSGAEAVEQALSQLATADEKRNPFPRKRS